MALRAIPRLFVDFISLDDLGRVRLNCVGTFQDLEDQQISLEVGLKVQLYNEEVEADGTVAYSEIERLWVASLDTKPPIRPA